MLNVYCHFLWCRIIRHRLLLLSPCLVILVVLVSSIIYYSTIRLSPTLRYRTCSPAFLRSILIATLIVPMLCTSESMFYSRCSTLSSSCDSCSSFISYLVLWIVSFYLWLIPVTCPFLHIVLNVFWSLVCLSLYLARHYRVFMLVLHASCFLLSHHFILFLITATTSFCWNHGTFHFPVLFLCLSS